MPQCARPERQSLVLPMPDTPLTTNRDAQRLYPRSCLPADHETAESAVRNLNGHDLGGRPLRIDLADSDPFLEGKTTVRGELVDGGETRAQWRERHERERDRERNTNPNAFLQQLPPGVPVPPGSTALDTISTMLARADPSQILEVLAQMKVRNGISLLASVFNRVTYRRPSSSRILNRRGLCSWPIHNLATHFSRHYCLTISWTRQSFR